MTGVPDLALPLPEIPFIADHNLTSFLWSAADLMAERINGIISAMDAHSAPSTQALNSESIRVGLHKLLLRQGKLHENVKARAAGGGLGWESGAR